MHSQYANSDNKIYSDDVKREILELNNPGAQDVLSFGDEVIGFEDAWNYVGQKKYIVGVVKYLFNSYKATVIGFIPGHRGETKLRIMSENYGAFRGDPVKFYQIGMKIKAYGKIEWYQGDPVIYINEPQQIQVLN